MRVTINMMVIRRPLIVCWMGVLGIVIFSGCLPYHYNTHCFFDVEAFKDIASVAVLPFHNLSQEPNAGLIMTNMLMAELVELDKFRVVKYGDIRQFFFNRRMTSVYTIDRETLRSLRKEFKVEAVITGTILQFEDGQPGEDGKAGSNRGKEPALPYIAVVSTILDTRSGRILGKGEFIEKGSAAGYLLGNKDRQVAFVLAKKLAQRLVHKIGTDGA